MYQSKILLRLDDKGPIMVKSSVLLFIALSSSILLFSMDSHSKDIEDSKIEAVVVYRQGALVKRTSQFQLESGRQTVVFKALSPGLNPESIRILTPASMSIISVQHVFDFFQSAPKSEAIASLKLQQNDLTDSIANWELKIKALQQRLDVLTANQEKAADNTQELQAWLDYHASVSEGIFRDQYRARKKIGPLKEELQKVEKQIGLLSNEGDRMSEIRLVVENEQAGNQQLELLYLVNDASWEPTYDIKAKATSDLEWHYKAIIQQNTSEDWKDVKLSLSNAEPFRSAQIPTLYPWYIDYEQKRLYATRNLKANEQAEYMDQAVVAESGLAVSALDANTAEYSTRIDLEIPQLFTLPSSTERYTLGLDVHMMKSRFERVAYPRMQKEVFLKAFITDWQQYNFLPGQANLYVDNAFVGKTYLHTNQATDTLEVSLGIDQSVEVERKLKAQQGRKKLLGGNRFETRSYQYIIKNRKSTAVEVMVYDQIPLARRTDIEVTIDELGDGMLEKDTGIVKWVRSVSEASNSEFVMGYTVKYPKNKYIPLY